MVVNLVVEKKKRGRGIWQKRTSSSRKIWANNDLIDPCPDLFDNPVSLI